MNAPTRKLKAHVWAKDSDSFYVEPSWCSAALFWREQFAFPIWDPACGLGRVVDAARRFGHEARGTDKVKRSEFCQTVVNFLDCDVACSHDIVSNPPLHVANEFVAQALALTVSKVAMLLPATWHCGSKRSAWLKTTPLRRVYALTPRSSMPPGAVILSGVEPGGGTTDYNWYVWLRGYDGPVELTWLHRDDEHGAPL